MADLHADDFGSSIDPATGLARRWGDAIAMARWVALDAKARGADALIVAGDFTESRNPAPWRVAQIGEAIAEFGGPTILLRGNHDSLRGDRSIADTLAHGRPDWYGFSRPGITRLGTTAIVSLPYLDRHHVRSMPGYENVPEADVYRVLGEAFVSIAAGLYAKAAKGAKAVVLAVHQGLAGGLMSDVQAAFLGDLSLVVDTRALTAIGYDAVLAGHFHRQQTISDAPLVAYAGAPLRTDFGEEHQAKAYLVVDVEPGARTALEVIETPARRWVTLDDATIGQARELAPDAIVRARFSDPDVDVADVRRYLEELGAFAVTDVVAARREAVAVEGGLSESLSAPEALEAYFADDADRAALVERGRELLAAVA